MRYPIIILITMMFSACGKAHQDEPDQAPAIQATEMSPEACKELILDPSGDHVILSDGKTYFLNDGVLSVQVGEQINVVSDQDLVMGSECRFTVLDGQVAKISKYEAPVTCGGAFEPACPAHVITCGPMGCH